MEKITYEEWQKTKPTERKCCGNCKLYGRVDGTKYATIEASDVADLGFKFGGEYGCKIGEYKNGKNIKGGYYNNYCLKFK